MWSLKRIYVGLPDVPIGKLPSARAGMGTAPVTCTPGTDDAHEASARAIAKGEAFSILGFMVNSFQNFNGTI